VVETARRREIEDVASTLFREHGYAGTSVRDIARALDIQGASLYAHVTSKQDVLWSIVERAATRFETSADAALLATSTAPDAVDGVAPAPTRLAALVRAHVAVVTEDIGRASVFVHEWRSLTGERRTQMARRRDAYERRFRAIIDDGAGAGAFLAVDPIIAAAFLLTSLNGVATWYRPDGRVSPAALADAYAELAVEALRVGSRRMTELPGEAAS
jgi:TetR/AcrR family transcriptional regulator, cholesterol catabolism regulator